MAKTNEIRVAIGSSGSAPGYCAATSLGLQRKRLCSEVFACDVNPRHLVAASTEASFIQLPSAMEDDFSTRASHILEASGVTHFYPIHDAEIWAATRDVQVFRGLGIEVCASPFDAVGISTDKLAMYRCLRSAGVPTPITMKLREAAWLEGGLIAKPRRGVGSHGLRVFKQESEWKNFVQGADSWDEDIIIQPYIHSPEITIDVFAGRSHNVLTAVCRERLEVKAGITTKARVFESPELRRLSQDIAQTIGLLGAFCFQVRHDRQTNSLLVIDVNPRIGGATAMSVALGCNLPAAHVALFTGQKPEEFILPVIRESFVVRSFREHVTFS